MVGIDAKNKHILDIKYICPVCTLILRDPVQLNECGHRQCQSCFDAEHEITIKCRQCQSETSRTKILLDRGFINDMKSIPIECFSCQWTGVLNNYQIIRAEMEDHYLTEQHQHAIMKVVRQMLLQLSGRQVDYDLSQITTAGTCDLATTQLQELFEMLNMLSGVIETLNNDQERLSNESLQIQVTIPTLTEELSKVKLSIEESNAFLEGVKHNQGILNQDLALLQEKINDFQYVSYDGTLVWKITNFQEKMSKLSNYSYDES
ncbi:unnamed protein product [Rotaria sordida]|uniref:RING-type domain-containing protein n=2 Tax=Rotaria sordida TaxID=392033 RepID=A0A813WAU1_9BILA|nr:unnamed protein product [Rotaria sordida]